MLQIKNVFDPPDPQDGLRLWIGSVGLTRDLAAWCHVDGWLREGSPSAALAQWFEENPGGWEYFRGKHHEELGLSASMRELRTLSRRAINENITLLHGETDAQHNVAVSLYEFLVELQAYASDDQSD